MLFVNNKIEVIDINEESFNKCSGWISKEHDCLSPKGFQHVKINLNGQRVDIYNTHLDAGLSKWDSAARKSQVEHIESYINKNSEGYPVVIAGDFNVEFSSDENPIIYWFINALDLEIVDWSADDDLDLPERVDYIFFRGSESSKISLIDYGIDDNLNGLSDHPPIGAQFSIRSK